MAQRGGGIQVKNRAPAPIQITAEQLLREANDRKLEEGKLNTSQLLYIYILNFYLFKLYIQTFLLVLTPIITSVYCKLLVPQSNTSLIQRS